MRSVNYKIIIISLLIFIGVWNIGQGSYIYAKAYLAQYLIESSWQTVIQNQEIKKPWPWADTWPVSRMLMAEHDVDLYILAGDNGRTLAFGPGYRFGTPKPGDIGNSIISAHRDTHFEFLKNVAVDEKFTLQTDKGLILEYQIVDIRISHYQNAMIPDPDEVSMLTLVTCFPFDRLTIGGPLRYLVIAEQTDKGVSL